MVIVTMIAFFPLGLVLMWLYAPWRVRTKWIWSGVFAVLTVFGIIGTVTGGSDNSTMAIVNTPMPQRSPTFTPMQATYIAVVATQAARPTDVPPPPTSPPAPPTQTPVVVYVPAAPAPTVPPPPPIPAADGTVSQQNALKKAKEYLQFMSFSRSGLIHQLEFEGFSTADATWGVDRLNVDWNEQAAKKAKEYLQFMAFSRSGLIEQLEFEGFTPAQAEYGVSQAGL